MAGRRGARQPNPCWFCGQPGSWLRAGVRACDDAHACSERMQAQGLGRRDWSAVEREALRGSLASILRRAAAE